MTPRIPAAEKQMTKWYNYCSNAQWNSPHELKAGLRNASILKNNRVVFLMCVAISIELLCSLTMPGMEYLYVS